MFQRVGPLTYLERHWFVIMGFFQWPQWLLILGYLAFQVIAKDFGPNLHIYCRCWPNLRISIWTFWVLWTSGFKSRAVGCRFQCSEGFGHRRFSVLPTGTQRYTGLTVFVSLAACSSIFELGSFRCLAWEVQAPVSCESKPSTKGIGQSGTSPNGDPAWTYVGRTGKQRLGVYLETSRAVKGIPRTRW